MRHRFTNQVVVLMAVLLTTAAAVFAAIALQTTVAGDRVDSILGIDDPDLEAGEQLYVEATEPTCASCHTLAAAGVEADGGPSLDALQPSPRETVISIIGGQVGAHEAQNYRIELNDREIAELAAYIAAVTG